MNHVCDGGNTNVYICNPKLNTDCGKEHCWWYHRDGECSCTINPDKAFVSVLTHEPIASTDIKFHKYARELREMYLKADKEKPDECIEQVIIDFHYDEENDLYSMIISNDRSSDRLHLPYRTAKDVSDAVYDYLIECMGWKKVFDGTKFYRYSMEAKKAFGRKELYKYYKEANRRKTNGAE